MTYYYYGDEIVPEKGQSMAERMKELGISEKAQNRLVDWASGLEYCCSRYRAYYDIAKDVLDLGRMERIGAEVPLPTEIVEEEGITAYKWREIKFCPFCGRSLHISMLDELKIDVPMMANGWLDGMRHAEGLTDEERQACEKVLEINNRIRKRVIE